ncbi:MAG: hypothetical protein GX548_10330 [Lentisphaerae bacterium]|nr:hypothetical protein [Lentisphaerota bacterium]
MKRFRYSLQRVLDIRELAVTQCEAMLAESKRALQARQAEEHQFGSAMRKASDDILSTSTRTPQPSRDCAAQRVWFQYLADCHQQAVQATRQEDERVDQRRAKLTRAMLEHKVIENLSRRERCEWLERLRLAEQKTMDEVAAGTRERRKHAKRPESSSFRNPAGVP